jgi:mono/diheme cytochrome c family protein
MLLKALMRSCGSRLLLLFAATSLSIHGLGAAEPSDADLERQFTQNVKPFVTTYCVACHGGATPAAGFDLRPYTSLSTVVREYPQWNLVLEKLSAGQMPPKGLKQPPAEARQAIVDWVKAVRNNEARKNAGDPGTVLARRLSNAEYNYTIRDLTGMDLKPTKEFPVDPANPAGFDNSGESLTMSPALLNKYLQAARETADHMVLTPDGFDFAPHPMLVETDRDRYAIQRIVRFYESQPTDYADYFKAAWKYKNRAALGKPAATLASIAAESKLSAKYLPMVWDILEGKTDEVGPIAKLRGMWRKMPAPGVWEEEIDSHTLVMRDFVARIREHTAMEFIAPLVRGLPQGSQPLINYKWRQFNSHRRNSDPEALRNDSDPPPVLPEIPRYPGLHQESGYRAAAVMKVNRAGDPDLVVPAAEHARYQAAFEKFANVFPDHFYVRERGRFYPDESQDKGRLLSAGYHNVMGYWRDDTPLGELILDEQGKKQLERLWTEFDFIAEHTNRTWAQFYFNQSGAVDGKGAESGTLRPVDQALDSPEVIFAMRDKYIAKAEAAKSPDGVEAMKYHFQWINDTLRGLEKLHAEAEPLQVQELLKFTAKAYRRPLTGTERDDVVSFYHTLREKNSLSHEDAIRDSIVRVLMSPKFLYRIDLKSGAAATAKATKPATGAAKEPLSDYAMASKLSYLLWSSMPDEELLAHAKAGDLQKPEVLKAQAHRMLKDAKVRDLATEFGGNWLDFRRFETIGSVDRERFPSFTNELRDAMFEEPVRFLEDVIRGDRSMLDVVYGKYTFVNSVLAKHYGIPGVMGGPNDWVRIDNASKYGRGGVLPMAAFLTQNAPGLRTSPVKRGYWVIRRVLGEVVPPPPPNVPELPHDEAKMDAPLREVLAQHRNNPACASCHQKFDDYGLAFENYGPIGLLRTKDLAGHPVDTKVTFPNGLKGEGFEAIQQYIRERRQNDYVDNVSRKLLAYSLNRSLMLSDEPTVEQMKAAMTANGYRFSPLIDVIVTSSQFRNKRAPEAREQRGE